MGASSCERPASVGTAPRTPESSTVSEKSAVSTNSTESLQILPATAVPRENTEAIELGETEKEEIKGQVLVQLNDELSECLTFMRPTAAYRYNVDKRRTFQNNMLFGIGLLEFANAGDFAANVWNEIPAPIYAQVLMAVGGTFALCVSYFGFKDASLSWNNVVLLRDERRFLRTRKAAGAERKVIGRDEDVRLDVNFRENGTEMADRFGMDIIMGFAAVVVGVGTLLALGGRNENVYRASNLLSGYIGNGPAAFWGLTNVAWCLFVWRRMQRHHIATTREFPEGDPICAMMWRRTRIVMGHAAVYGTAGFIAGIASLITSTRWWGYVILAPCILAAVGSNHIFRHYILYDRVSIQEMPLVDKAAIIRQLRGILLIREIVNGAFSPAIAQLNSRPLSLPSVLQCILELGLYEDFCIRILKDPTLAVALFGQENEDIVIDSRRLARITDSVSVQCLLEIAQSCLADLPKMCSHDRETFLVETLGCLLCVSHPDAITRLGKRLGHDIEMV